jgi:hypothetical protein
MLPEPQAGSQMCFGRSTNCEQAVHVLRWGEIGVSVDALVAAVAEHRGVLAGSRLATKLVLDGLGDRAGNVDDGDLLH